jgi:hypothetical protein
MLITFMNGKIPVGKLTQGQVVYCDEEQKYGHIVRFARNTAEELIMMVAFDNGDAYPIHPSNLKFMDIELLNTDAAVMCKESAEGVLTFQTEVAGAIQKLLSRLMPQERQFAEWYYIGRIRDQINGIGKGAAPVERAKEMIS